MTLDTLRALTDAMTPGEWEMGGGINDPLGPNPTRTVWGPTPPGMQSGAMIAQRVTKADAAGIVALHNAATKLLDVVEAVKAVAGAFHETECPVCWHVAHKDDCPWPALVAALAKLEPK